MKKDETDSETISRVVKAQRKIDAEIEPFRQEYGGKPSEWQAGITNDPKERKSEHITDDNFREGDPWKAIDAGTKELADMIEMILHEKGYKGGLGGGNEDSRYVYVFKRKV